MAFLLRMAGHRARHPGSCGRRDPVAQEEYPDTVYQCPGMEKQKQCPEKSMDVNSLRIHWGWRHNVDGRPFPPLQMSVNELEHCWSLLRRQLGYHLAGGRVRCAGR